jgi:hypothetical protein
MSMLRELIERLQCGFDEAHYHDCVQKGWVKTEAPDETDISRAQLIHILRYEFAVEEETLPLMLSLLDQLHGTRRILHHLTAIIHDQRDEVRAEIIARLSHELDKQ